MSFLAEFALAAQKVKRGMLGPEGFEYSPEIFRRENLRTSGRE